MTAYYIHGKKKCLCVCEREIFIYTLVLWGGVEEVVLMGCGH